MVARRHTEYGGGEGGIQRGPRGESKPLSPAEEARVRRMKGTRAGVLGLDSPGSDEFVQMVPTADGPRPAKKSELTDQELERRAYLKAEQDRIDKNANKYNREVN